MYPGYEWKDGALVKDQNWIFEDGMWYRVTEPTAPAAP